ncbi:MAG: bifunctional glutamate N-acetyltransferase/amino-acid acetyltransferase ArgJ [Pseudomonadota bacterium]
MTTKTSPFAPSTYPDMPKTNGMKIATAKAGIKYKGRRDLLLAVFEPGTVVAGVLTQSKTRSAAVDWCAEQLKHGQARALVVNSGNANAFTGKRGKDAVRQTAEAAAKAVGCEPEEVFIASTGVIGEPLDVTGFAHLLGDMAETASPTGWTEAAHAIMTTDTFPKLATSAVTLQDGAVGHLNGIAKGAGMIAPDMATMLSFLATDLAVDPSALRTALKTAADASFNAITVDSDTSTSDTLLMFATGKNPTQQDPLHAPNEPNFKEFQVTLEGLTHDLSQAIICDGEGITKLITVLVKGAEHDQAAKRIGMAIANSPLVKTAIAGEDPNWGRIVMAVGKSGEAANRDTLSIWFGPHRMASMGERAPDHSEAEAAAYMKGDHIDLIVDIGIGDGQATVWTCDLTHEYISINADYRS